MLYQRISQLMQMQKSLQEVTSSWFPCLFCTALPPETVVRIWDVLILEGPKILFRVALALFKASFLSSSVNRLDTTVFRYRHMIGRCPSLLGWSDANQAFNKS